MNWLAVGADVLGAGAALLAGLQTWRASDLLMQARELGMRLESTPSAGMAELLALSKERSELEARWKPIDHYRLVGSFALLALSYLISFLSTIMD